MNRILSLLILLTSVITIQAQEFSGGFKAGLNFSWMDGPSEQDNAMEAVEDFSANTGFHIGATASIKLSDQFGLRAELLYSQKGSQYDYDGISYWRFFPDAAPEVVAIGNRKTDLNITNTYVELPLLAYARFGRIEFSGGVGAALLIGSRATGTTTFTSATTAADPFTVTLEYNYLKDKPGESVGTEQVQVNVGGGAIAVPSTVGAYYQGADSDKNLFSTLDLNLNVGTAFYLNQGLYLGFRLNYGLLDTTKSDQDVTRTQLGPDQNYLLRDDQDRNISLQASLGFRF